MISRDAMSVLTKTARVALGVTWFGPSQIALREAVAGKVVLVTGASSGIGAATAHKLGAAGATVLLVARTQAGLEAVRDRIVAAGGTSYVLPADLGDIRSVEALVQRILDEHGGVDIVVSNAGKSIRRSIGASGDRFHDFTRTIDINYLGPVRLLLGLLPSMRERRGGHIVSVGTIGIDFPVPQWSAYIASKSAFDVWLRCVSPEVRVDGVATTSIHFPLVHTPMSAPTPSLRRLPGMSADEAADAVCRALVSRPRQITPWWARAGRLAMDVAQVPIDVAFTRLIARRSGERRPDPRLRLVPPPDGGVTRGRDAR